MSHLCCSAGANALSRVCCSTLCVIDVSAMLSCLKVQDTSEMGILVLELFIFLSRLDRAAAEKTEIYLVTETENIDQEHVLLREDKHAGFIPRR